MFLTMILVSASLITGGPAQQSATPPKAQMLKLYRENAQMREQSRQLAVEIESIDRKTRATKDAIANLQYTRAENQGYLDTLAARAGSRFGDLEPPLF